MSQASATSLEDVFVNCPFDDDGQARIEKLYGLIKECRYGIHDISRTELDCDTRLPRFNMPLELGLFMGAKCYGSPRQRDKRLLIFDREKYRYQTFISDLAGMDIHAHSGRPDLNRPYSRTRRQNDPRPRRGAGHR